MCKRKKRDKGGCDKEAEKERWMDTNSLGNGWRIQTTRVSGQR